MDKVKIGIVGSSGYVAGELIRTLIHHPYVSIDFVFSHSNSGAKIGELHDDLAHLSAMTCTDVVNPEVDLVFLCLGHGNSGRFLEKHAFSNETKIIDLSNEFRLKESSKFQDASYIYGLTELQAYKIEQATAVANPGCFATAIQLALLPLAKKQELKDDIHIHAITGATGAGKGLSETSHFSWRNNNVSIYKPFAHQHLAEIGETVSTLQPSFQHEINFIPVRGNFTRGIFASVYLNTDLSEEELKSIYQKFYEKEPFTHVVENGVHLKQVVNTNHCFLHVQKQNGKVLITSVIDNLLKGAAGQAIENMNLLFGWDQATGLQLKSNYF